MSRIRQVEKNAQEAFKCKVEERNEKAKNLHLPQECQKENQCFFYSYVANWISAIFLEIFY